MKAKVNAKAYNNANAKKVFKILFFSLLMFNATSFIFAESFRIRKTVILNLSEITNEDGNINETQVQEVHAQEVGINDGVCIMIPKDLTFIQGIELSIKIPTAISKCPNTIIYSLYENISPVPSANTIDYTGKELYTAIYPGLISHTIQIPLVKGNTLKKTPYADKTLIPEHSRNFIFLRNQLVMKGIPHDAMSSTFSISAKPILNNKGRLVIKTANKKDNSLTILVDGSQVELDANNSCLLKPGLHNVVITADSARNENRSCMIEAGKTSVLSIDLQSTTPLLKINMPQGTQVILDNTPCELTNNSISITPGEHVIKFNLGGYEIVKHISIQEGRNYSMNMSLDIDLSEN